MKRMTASIFLVSFLIVARAQSPSPTPTFDVASLKPSPPSPTDRININLGTYQHGVVTLGNTTLSECIRYAYGLVSEDQIEGPDWIRDRQLRFGIEAKTAPDTPADLVRSMLQNLLAQRFHLELHRTPRPLRHFDLTIAKNGPKLHPSPEGGQTALKGYGRGRLAYDHIPIRTLAVLLSRQMKQPVIDITGLEGFFDIDLEWTPDDLAGENQPKRETGDVAPLPDIYKAVQEQLGLLLEPKKTPIDVLVVDHADKAPVAN